jgi:hypothetical protein
MVFSALDPSDSHFEPDQSMLMFTEEPHVNFPRQQLKYLRELGRGWFGRVSSH